MQFAGVVPAKRSPMPMSERLTKESCENNVLEFFPYHHPFWGYVFIYVHSQVVSSSRWWSLDGDFILAW